MPTSPPLAYPSVYHINVQQSTPFSIDDFITDAQSRLSESSTTFKLDSTRFMVEESIEAWFKNQTMILRGRASYALKGKRSRGYMTKPKRHVRPITRLPAKRAFKNLSASITDKILSVSALTRKGIACKSIDGFLSKTKTIMNG